jgi:recombination protein RecA
MFAKKDVYVCKECGKEFASMTSLGGHASVVHSTANRAGLSKASKKMWAERTPEERAAVAAKSLEMRNKWRYDVELTEVQRQLILGGLMGDMSILYPNSRSSFPRLIISQSAAQEEYLMWKYSILKNLIKSPPVEVVNHGYCAGKIMIRAQTMSLPCFTPIYNLVKVGKKTSLSKEWLDEIDHPIALATWYLDDGSLIAGKNKKYRKVYGHSISIASGYLQKEQASVLSAWMDRTWGVPVKINWSLKSGNPNPYATVHINKAADVDAFLAIVRPYAVPCMDYKVTRDYTYTT